MCVCSNHDDGKLSRGTCMTFCFTRWASRAFSSRCRKHVSVDRELLKIQQEKTIDLGVPSQMPQVSQRRQRKRKKRNKKMSPKETQRKTSGRQVGKKIFSLSMRTRKNKHPCLNTKVQYGERW